VLAVPEVSAVLAATVLAESTLVLVLVSDWAVTEPVLALALVST